MKLTTIMSTAIAAVGLAAVPLADRGTFDAKSDGLWPCFVINGEAQTAIRRYLW